MTLQETINEMCESIRQTNEAWEQIRIANEQILTSLKEATANLERVLNGY